MEILFYSENGVLKAHLGYDFAEKFLALVINKTKQITLKSKEKAFEYIEEEQLWFGIKSVFTVSILKGEFFVIK